MELMVVILIVGILAAAAIPLMRGRIDSAKWSEANATAGTIRSAVRVYFAETGGDATKMTAVCNTLDDATVQSVLGFNNEDLQGTFFSSADYEITAVNGAGMATIEATGSQANAPTGTKTLAIDGTWQ